MQEKIYEDNWPLFEKVLGYLRYLTVKKYITDEGKPVCADVGCGFNGRFLFSIASKIKRGYGIDIRANEVEKGNITLINNSLCGGGIPLESNSVDRVFSLAVIEHLNDKDLALIFSESVRILRPAGKIILTTPTPLAKPVLEFLSFRLGLISRESILEHKHYWNKRELFALMERYGCEVVKYKKFQFGMNQLLVAKKISKNQTQVLK